LFGVLVFLTLKPTAYTYQQSYPQKYWMTFNIEKNQ